MVVIVIVMIAGVPAQPSAGAAVPDCGAGSPGAADAAGTDTGLGAVTCPGGTVLLIRLLTHQHQTWLAFCWGLPLVWWALMHPLGPAGASGCASTDAAGGLVGDVGMMHPAPAAPALAAACA